MKAKISYSVPLKKVPTVVSEILEESAEKLEALSLLVENLAKAITVIGEMEQAPLQVAAVRDELSPIETSLSECQNILVGYISAVRDSELPINGEDEEDDGKRIDQVS